MYRKFLKRFLPIALSVAMVVQSAPDVAYAAEPGNVETAQTDVEALEELEPDGVIDPSSDLNYGAFEITVDSGIKSDIQFAVPDKSFRPTDASQYSKLEYSKTAPSSSRLVVRVKNAAGRAVTVNADKEWSKKQTVGEYTYYYFINNTTSEGYTISFVETVNKYTLKVDKPSYVAVQYSTATNSGFTTLPDSKLDSDTYYLDVTSSAVKVREMNVSGAQKVDVKVSESTTKTLYKVDLTSDCTVNVTAPKVQKVTITTPSALGVTFSAFELSSTYKVDGKDQVTAGAITTNGQEFSGLIEGDKITMKFTTETQDDIVCDIKVNGKEVTGTKSGNKTSYVCEYTVVDNSNVQEFKVEASTRNEFAVSVTPSSVKAYIMDANKYEAGKNKKSDFTPITSGTKVPLDNSKKFYVYFDENVTIATTSEGITAESITKTVEMDDFVAYEFEAANGATFASIVAKVDESASITVNGDDKVDSIKRATNITASTAPDFNVGDTKKVNVAKGSTVKVAKSKDDYTWFQFGFKENYELGTVTIGKTVVSSAAFDTEIEVDGYKGKVVAGTGIVKVGVTATGSPVIAVTSKQSKVNQTFTATKTVITVDKDKLVDIPTGDALKADLVVTEGAAQTVGALKGEKINFTVAAEEGCRVTSVVTKSGMTTKELTPRNDGTRTYYTVTAGEEVKATATAVTYNVKFNKNSNVKSALAYEVKKDGKSVASNSAFETGTLNVVYGGELSIKPAAENKYVISMVRVQKSGQTSWTTISKGSDGYYNIGKLTSNVKVDIKATEDTSKQAAYSVTFDKSYVTVTEGTSNKLESAKEYKTVTTPVAIKVNTKAGYDSVLTIGTATKAAVNGTPVDILTKADDNKVVITTEAKKVTEDRYFSVDTPSCVGIEKVQVKTASGLVDPEKRNDKIVYQVDKSQKEVTVKVTLRPQYDYTDPYSFTELACKNVETVGVNKVYTFAIPVSILTKENERVKTIDIPDAEKVSKTVNLYLQGKFKSYVSGAKKPGEVVTVELYKGYSLYRVEKATDTDDEPLTKLTLTNQKYTFTIEKDTTLRAVKDVATTYVTTVAIGNAEASVKSEADVNVNDVVNIKAYVDNGYNDTSGSALKITKVELPKDAKSVAVVTKSAATVTDLVKLTVAKEDAGKTIKATLYSDVLVDGATKEVQVGEVTLKIKALPAGVSVVNGKTAIKNKGSITLNAVNTKTLGVTFTPANVDKNYYSIEVESGKNVKAAFDSAKKNIIINTGNTAEEAKIMIKDNTKTTDNVLFTFTVKTVVQDLKVKSLASTAQGIKDINITLTGDKAIGQGLTLGKAAYYKVVVTPAKTSKVGTKAPTGESTYTYYIPFGTSVSYKAIVNAVATAEDAKKAAWTYDFEASVIIANAGTKAGSTAPAGIVVEGKDTVKKSFNTKNAYYEDKLSVTKKTTNIYNGQQNVLAGIVKFSKNASYTDIKQTATVLNADGTPTSKITAKVDEVGNIFVSANTTCKAGKYQVVVEAEAEVADAQNKMYAAKATLPIVIKSSQYSISVTAPKTLVVAGKNAKAKLSVKATDYYGDKSAVQKFNFELVNTNGEKLVADTNANKNILKNVSIKNGTVTVSKNFQISGVSGENTFYVKVSATDHKDYLDKDYSNGVEYDESIEGSRIVGITVTKEALVLKEIKIYDATAGEYVDANTELVKSHNYQARVFDADGKEVTSQVTFTPAAKYNKDGDPTSNGMHGASIEIAKAGKISIKATTTDGGKKSVSKTVTVGYDKFTDMNVKLDFGSQNSTMTGTNSYSYDGKGDASFNVSVWNGETRANQSSYNYKMTVKGAKLDRSKVIPTSNKVTITVKDQVNKKAKPVVITVENTNVITAKAPKVTLTNKLYTTLYKADGSYDPQFAQFKVASTEYNAVQITYLSGNGVISTGSYSVDADGKFSVPAWNDASARTAKYQMVFGTDDGSGFVVKTKPTNVTVKTTKVDPTKFKLNKSYTITPSNSVSVKLSGKPAEIKVAYTGVENANIKGASNNFTKLFQVSADGTLTHITTDAKYTELMADKNNFTGYVTYSYATSKGVVTKSEKIKVKINTKDLKYTATAATTMPGKAVTTTVKLGKTVVELKSVTAATTGWTATLGTDKKTITLTPSAASAGTNNVELKIVPKDSTSKDGISVTAKITVLDADKAAKKLTVIKGATTIDLAKAARVDGKLVYTVAADKVYTLVNGAVVKEIKAAEGTVDGLSIKLAEGKVVITADPAKLAENKSYKLNAIVVFDGAAVDEKIAFTVKTPAYADMSSTQTAVANALASFRATGNGAADQATVKTLVEGKIDPLTKITVESVTTSYVAARVSGDAIIAPKYEVCAQIKQGTGAAVAITKTVKVPVSDSKAIADELKGKIVYNTNTTTPSGLQIDARQLSSKYSAQKFFEKAVVGTDNKVEIQNFSYDAPVEGTMKRPNGTKGSVNITVKIYNDKEFDTIVVSGDIIAKKYVAPTTN